MSEAIIDLRYLAESQPSLCIPRVFNNVTEARIRRVFDEIGLGKIRSIDIKERKNEKGESFKRVFVHFEKWFWNEDAQAARRKLISGKEVKIVYDNPWFWKVSASKWGQNSDSQQRRDAPRPSLRPHIEFDDEPHPKTTDEFGRDLRLRRETEEHQRSYDSRRGDDRRGDDRRGADRRDVRKTTVTSVPIAQSLPQEIAHSLPRKAERPKSPAPVVKPFEPRSPSSSPPRMRLTKEEEMEQDALLKIDYGDVTIPPPKKHNIALKKARVLVVDADGSQREALKDVVVRCAKMSIEDKKSSDELYGDL